MKWAEVAENGIEARSEFKLSKAVSAQWVNNVDKSQCMDMFYSWFIFLWCAWGVKRNFIHFEYGLLSLLLSYGDFASFQSNPYLGNTEFPLLALAGVIFRKPFALTKVWNWKFEIYHDSCDVACFKSPSSLEENEALFHQQLFTDFELRFPGVFLGG